MLTPFTDLPSLVAFVGITKPSTQLLLNIIYAISGWIPAMIGARLHDVVGRRKMLLGVTASMAVCLAIAAGTAAGFEKTGSQVTSITSIAFIYIFGSVFALAFTSMQPIYPGEVLSNDMRAKGMGIYQLTAGCAGFVNTFAAPVALKNVRISHRPISHPVLLCQLTLRAPDWILVLRFLRLLGSLRVCLHLPFLR